MKLDEKIEQIRALLVQRDEVDQKIAALLGDAALSVQPTKGERQRKWHKANKGGKSLQDEIEKHHVAAPRRHPETDSIEELLITGASVPEVLEKVQVSAPTVYVIKARLKKEGKIS